MIQLEHSAPEIEICPSVLCSALPKPLPANFVPYYHNDLSIASSSQHLATKIPTTTSQNDTQYRINTFQQHPPRLPLPPVQIRALLPPCWASCISPTHFPMQNPLSLPPHTHNTQLASPSAAHTSQTSLW